MRFARIVPQVLVAWPPHIIPILGHRSRGAIPTRRLIALAAAFTALLAAAAVAQPPASDPPKKVVIPFDFESKFDNGEYGQTIGDMLWVKLHRQGGFVIPESMQDVRDWCQRTHMIPGPETTLEKMKEVVAREQAGDIGIWGKIERVQGFETDVYDPWINVADFSVDLPRWIYRKKARTQTVSEIPHIYVKEALDRLYGRTEQIAGAPEPELQKRWEKAPNLVKGDFEHGRSAPAGWDPLPHDATWVVVKGKDAKAGNRIIRFTMNEDVAGSTGVLYYSNFFPVEEGATYRFQYRWRTTGSAAKVFIKCYDELPTSFRTREGGDSLKTEKREVYRSQQNCRDLPEPGMCRPRISRPSTPSLPPAGDGWCLMPTGRQDRSSGLTSWSSRSRRRPRVSVRKIAGPRRKPRCAPGKCRKTRRHRPSPRLPGKSPGRKGRVEARVQIDRAWH